VSALQWGFAVGALGAAVAGFMALALAMDRHHRDSRGRAPAPRQAAALRGLGACALLLSLLASLARQGAAQGWVLWCGVLTAAALAVVLLLSYAPRRAAMAGAAAAGCALLALLGAVVLGRG